jgi:hypothetical protein
VGIPQELAYQQGYEQAEEDFLKLYSKALDEIFRLRQALAYEAAVTDAHLGLKTFPKSRRKAAEGQISRMRGAARGEARRTYSEVKIRACVPLAMKLAEADGSLTRAQFESEGDDAPVRTITAR